MYNINDWLQWGNIACLLPLAVLFIQYVLRTKWKTTETGRALAYLITLTTLNFGVNFLGTVTDNVYADWTRVGMKFLIAVGLINLVRIMEKARKEALDELLRKSLEDNGV